MNSKEILLEVEITSMDYNGKKKVFEDILIISLG